MKRIVTAFGQKTYISATGGTTTYQHELGLADVLYEVRELRSLLDNYISSACHITIMETGVAVHGDFVPQVKRRRDSQTPKQSPTVVNLEGGIFQSNEIWRRLGGVLASRASSAGWHCWMSGYPETFQLMGLRVDRHEPPTTETREAHTRWSWFAVARLAAVLGDVVAGEMILPAITSHADLGYMSKADGLVVFEYTLGSDSFVLHRYAYLVFYDPTSAANGATVEVSSTSSAVHASLVSTRINGPPSSSGGGQLILPTGMAIFDPDALLTLPAVLWVFKEDSPLLILTSKRLRWANVETFETAKP